MYLPDSLLSVSQATFLSHWLIPNISFSIWVFLVICMKTAGRKIDASLRSSTVQMLQEVSPSIDLMGQDSECYKMIIACEWNQKNWGELYNCFTINLEHCCKPIISKALRTSNHIWQMGLISYSQTDSQYLLLIFILKHPAGCDNICIVILLR